MLAVGILFVHMAFSAIASFQHVGLVVVIIK